MATKFKFEQVIARFQQVKSTLPEKLANDGQRFFISNFDKQGFTDVGFKPWPKRKDKKNNRRLLVKSGALRRAVNNSKKSATFDRITWEAGGIPYGVYQNDGTDKIPRRRFMGDSFALRMILKRKIDQEVIKCFK